MHCTAPNGVHWVSQVGCGSAATTPLASGQHGNPKLCVKFGCFTGHVPLQANRQHQVSCPYTDLLFPAALPRLQESLPGAQHMLRKGPRCRMWQTCTASSPRSPRARGTRRVALRATTPAPQGRRRSNSVPMCSVGKALPPRIALRSSATSLEERELMGMACCSQAIVWHGACAVAQGINSNRITKRYGCVLMCSELPLLTAPGQPPCSINDLRRKASEHCYDLLFACLP